MLPAAHRMRSRQEFAHAVRSGRAAARPTLVVHAAPHEQGPARVGFVVSKAVGGSVVRHRVTRRLRALVSDRLPRIPDGTSLVLRATPGAAHADTQQLGRDLDTALDRLGFLT